MASDTITPPEDALAGALKALRTGEVTFLHLLELIDEAIAGGVSKGILLKTLDEAHLIEPLPSATYRALWKRIDLPATELPTPVLSRQEPKTIVITHPDDAPDMLPAPAPQVIDVLKDRFRLLELLAEGGMGRVYKAIDLRRIESGSPDPYIAVKVLLHPFADEFASLAALEREAQRLQQLTHPNIVRIYDCDRDGDTVFMTMELLQGESLYAHLLDPAHAGPESALEPAQSQAIIAAVARALDYAHRHDVVHGDLKPGNIFITHEGEVKVIDFSIASWIVRPKTALERREIAGSLAVLALTPRYASPQLLARQKPEAADDVYALGCLAYELLTGRHPFENDAGRRFMHFPPPRLGMKGSHYDAIVHALALDRRSRTASAAEFLAEFLRTPWASRMRRAWPLALGLAALVAMTFSLRLLHTAASPIKHVANAQDQSPRPGLPAVASVLRDCPACGLFTVLPAGSFTQGSPNDDPMSLPFEQPDHRVTIARPFALSVDEVTVGEFSSYVAATKAQVSGCVVYDGGHWVFDARSSWQNPGFAQTMRHPVTCVSWHDAADYARWLSATTHHRYRLPSASEWEYAARGGSSVSAPWELTGGTACSEGNVADQSALARYHGWSVFACTDGFVHTAPVGSFHANAYGINDLLGNVFEWTEDCWAATYDGAPTDGSAGLDGDCSQRELRGGSWFSEPKYVRAAYRNHFGANYRTSSVGFRLVRELSP